MGEHITCLSKPSWTHLTVKKWQKQLKISKKPVCRQLGEPELILEGGFTKPTFRARSFLFSRPFWFSTGLACGGGVGLWGTPLYRQSVPRGAGHLGVWRLTGVPLTGVPPLHRPNRLKTRTAVKTENDGLEKLV